MSLQTQDDKATVHWDLQQGHGHYAATTGPATRYLDVSCCAVSPPWCPWTSGYHSSSVPFSTLSTVSSGDSTHHETRTKCHDSWACRSVFRLHHKTRKDHGRGQLTPIADLCLLDGLFLCSRDRMEHERSALDQPPPSQQRAPSMRGRRPGGGRSE